ncbi:hypothetical protein BC830DRAFT_1217786, partial [Chytriomyces sp. MP71]
MTSVFTGYTAAFVGTAILGLALNSVIVASSFKRLLRLSSSTFLTYFLCLSDALISAADAAIGIGSLAFGHSLDSKTTCHLHAVIQILGGTSSLLLCLGLIIIRYLEIIQDYVITLRVAQIYTASVLCFAIFVVTLPFILNSAARTYTLHPSGVYCCTDWAAKDPSSLAVITMNLITILPPVLFITYAYMAIYLKFAKSVIIMKSVSMQLGVENAPFPKDRNYKTQDFTATQSKCSEDLRPVLNASFSGKSHALSGSGVARATDEQVELLKQSVIIVSAFLIGWLPYAILILQEIATSQHWSPALDFFAIYCT